MGENFLIVHIFLDCSYHDNAYAASRALHIVDLVNPSDTFKLLEAFFEHQVFVLFNLLHTCIMNVGNH